MLDRDSYRVGSTALLTIKSSKPNLYAIFTLERGGRVVREEFLKIDGRKVISIPY